MFNFLNGLVRYTGEYVPYSSKGHWFRQIEKGLLKLENWQNRICVHKDLFEELVGENEKLAEEYVDAYSATAEYFIVVHEVQNEFYELYVMTDNEKIVLFFYRKSF